ncbi:MAG TPA: regulatory protein RecX [Candidatus Saccharimonadales bacterium]|nr:regulatory protein RecX [Candidatus Saccharimonadales bacterium]
MTEVRRRLGQAGYRSELIDGAIERLTELGMLDDEQFARAWVESRDRVRPRGERAIREELRLKGIDRSTADLVLEERRVGISERAVDDGAHDDAPARSPDRVAAERLIAKHARALARVADPRQRRQRAYALLARNGFDPETCREVAASAGASPAESEEADEPDAD